MVGSTTAWLVPQDLVELFDIWLEQSRQHLKDGATLLAANRMEFVAATKCQQEGKMLQQRVFVEAQR